VNEYSLASLAEVLSLDENIFLGKGEFKNAGNKKESLLADAFEALCAAIYLDSNESLETLEKTLIVIIDKFEIHSGKTFFSLNHLESFDSKSQLQELTVALFQMRPEYKSQSSSEGEFLVELWVGERKLAEGHGPSKKKLEKELARVVLDEKRYL
jgi:ribonuclease-3